jgi:hypothetical protein
MKPRTWILFGLLGVATLTYAGRMAYRILNDLVTIDVENMPVRDVAAKLRWQTWEDIRVHKETEGVVTLKTENAPLEVVLGLIARQTSVRWTPVAALYRSGGARKRLDSIADGLLEQPAIGWTNYSSSPDFGFRRMNATNGPGGMPGFGGGPFGGGGPGGGDEDLSSRNPVDLSLTNASPAEASSGLRRASRMRVVSEDSLGGRVTLALEQVPAREAARQLAKRFGAKTDLFYVLEPRRRPQITPEMREQMTAAFGGERPNFEDMRARMEERMSDPNVQQQMIQRQIQRLKTTTPEQRAEQQRNRRGGRGGPGGGRGGPP